MGATLIIEITDPEVLQSCPGHRFFTSLEGENPGGSIKDRMVIGELEELLGKGILQPNDCVGEVSAGSTAKSLAFHTKRLGLRCVLFVPDSLAATELDQMRTLGAEVHPVKVERAYEAFEAFCTKAGVHPFNQAKDKTKRRFYSNLGSIAQAQIGKIDTLVGAVGTGHSLLGVADGIHPKPYLVTAEPRDGGVSGIRNLERDRYGEDDPCDPSLFDRRVVLSVENYFSKSQILTSVGVVEIPDSFRVVLGALSSLAEDRRRNVFLLGASNGRFRP